MVGIRGGRETRAFSCYRNPLALTQGVGPMWVPAGRKVQSNELGLIEPAEILFEFGSEPLTFVARDPCGDLLLVHSLCVFDRTSRYLVSAVDDRILGDLKSGRLDLRSALRQPRCWVADIQEDAAVSALWRV